MLGMRSRKERAQTFDLPLPCGFVSGIPCFVGNPLPGQGGCKYGHAQVWS